MPTTRVILVDPIHKAQYTIMSSAFPLPLNADNQDIWQNHTLKILHHVPLRGGHTPPFPLQIQAIVQ